MSDSLVVTYNIQTQLELNLSYMPFIKNGGIFIPTNETYSLGEHVLIELTLPGHNESQKVHGRVVWINPKNALYQIYPGIGVEFVGDNAKSFHETIKANIDNTHDVGGYVYGLSGDQVS
ncbi:hypothetical protein AQUSIP_24010 [Aquicella siphonis]|uniref:PilZ domain-containing protein n=1 Tax=Aquicella siphonis TaxID=254247 RepID=A0A5E4PJD2_9COXI|nr:PilZ domain-containing protein [Aquicella siphonis]VVC77074.1 hypothetical protein AQUSIP_24010 [Aquicella siphonis]